MALHTNKDKQMAAYLKSRGDDRRTGVCVVCGRLLRLAELFNHYATHG